MAACSTCPGRQTRYHTCFRAAWRRALKVGFVFHVISPVLLIWVVFHQVFLREKK